MTLRDDLAVVLGPGNDDATAYAQADSVLAVLDTVLDLHEGRAANLVAKAIDRYYGPGYVPFSRRYPWLTWEPNR